MTEEYRRILAKELEDIRLVDEDDLEYYLLGGFKPRYKRSDVPAMSKLFLSFNNAVETELTKGSYAGLFDPLRLFDELYRTLELYIKYQKENDLGKFIAHKKSLKFNKVQNDYFNQSIDSVILVYKAYELSNASSENPPLLTEPKLNKADSSLTAYEKALRHYYLECSHEENYITGKAIVDKYGQKQVESFLNKIRADKGPDLNRRGIKKVLQNVINALSNYKSAQKAATNDFDKLN